MSDRTNVLTVAPSDRESGHEFIDRLGDEEAKRIRRIMAAATGNPLLRSLLLAEYDDEPYTEERRAHVDKALQGPFLTEEQVREELGE